MGRHGFSLVELSIVLTILAVVAGGGLALTTASSHYTHVSDSYEEMDRINDALSIFVNENGRLPCPARLDRPRGDAEFGREATDCADAGPPSGITYVEYPPASTQFVRIGGVPFYSLGLSSEYMGDEWNNRYLYAVADAFITAVAVDDTGHILIQDAAATTLTDRAAWVVVSHGLSGVGSTPVKGTTARACTAGATDTENCDADGIFVSTVYDDGNDVNGFFDDLVDFETVIQLFGGDEYIGDCSGGAAAGINGASCYMYLSSTDTFAAQEAACVAWGGHLASITSAAEQSYIEDTLLSGGFTRAWIGLNDVAVEGTYVWEADDSALGSWDNWEPTEPVAGANDCVSMYESGSAEAGEWTMTGCAASYAALCEKQ